ncbi:hypothetical protein K466DRAFT_606622 [Polyporus arcularius HHB13444]|uniref:Uncharacterized protein n=1 Tax=Polyporus arcularius HHB13444 TaxID=1314778 RepID=A0A5C3NMA3_9APHY|nr:hypothetical protein K466DRAFT_606622 [Polyporus arcularius HHB13444]
MGESALAVSTELEPGRPRIRQRACLARCVQADGVLPEGPISSTAVSRSGDSRPAACYNKSWKRGRPRSATCLSPPTVHLRVRRNLLPLPLSCRLLLRLSRAGLRAAYTVNAIAVQTDGVYVALSRVVALFATSTDTTGIDSAGSAWGRRWIASDPGSSGSRRPRGPILTSTGCGRYGGSEYATRWAWMYAREGDRRGQDGRGNEHGGARRTEGH